MLNSDFETNGHVDQVELQSGGDNIHVPNLGKPKFVTSTTKKSSHLTQVLCYGLILRFVLLAFSVWQDSARWPDGQLRFTDIDYDVFSDAARAMISGVNLYEARPTYRYSPLVAAVLAPGYYLFSMQRVTEPDEDLGQVNLTSGSNYEDSGLLFVSPSLAYLWGKFIFIMADLACAYLQYVIICERFLDSSTDRNQDETSSPSQFKSDRLALTLICFGWLFNPVTAVVSVRGNADALQSLFILATLLCILKRQLVVAGLLYGLCIHLRIYPVIYAPVIYLWLIQDLNNLFSKSNGLLHKIGAILPNRFHFAFGLSTLASLCGLTWFCYAHFGGMLFLHQAYLYHLERLDFKHNFAPHFLPIYLLSSAKHMESINTSPTPSFVKALSSWMVQSNSHLSNWFSQWASAVLDLPWWWKYFDTISSSIKSPYHMLEKLFNFAALLPSIVLIPCLSFKLHNYPGLSWFSLTYAFVTFNKVCTSQYFMWSLALLPIALAEVTLPKHMSTFRAIVENLLIWFGAQGVWLLCAYLLEMCTLTNPIMNRIIWLLVWSASIFYFASNCLILRRLMSWRTKSSQFVSGHNSIPTSSELRAKKIN